MELEVAAYSDDMRYDGFHWGRFASMLQSEEGENAGKRRRRVMPVLVRLLVRLPTTYLLRYKK